MTQRTKPADGPTTTCAPARTPTVAPGGGAKTITYGYNANGLRARRVADSLTKVYSWQGNSLGSIESLEAPGGGAMVTKRYAFSLTGGMISNALARHEIDGDGGDSLYYQYDHRGNVVAATDSSGNLVYSYLYDAFGNAPFSYSAVTGGAMNADTLLVTGKDLDPDTGLYYFNARWYDSTAGVFVSRAQYRADAEHPYGFCRNNPETWVDSNGEIAFFVTL